MPAPNRLVQAQSSRRIGGPVPPTRKKQPRKLNAATYARLATKGKRRKC